MWSKRAMAIALFGLVINLFQYYSNASAATGAAPPTSITTKVITNGIVVNWSAPADTSTITNYRVEYSTDGNAWTQFDTVSSTTFSDTITSLTYNASYYVRVAAKASGGWGAYGYPWTEIYRVTNGTRVSTPITNSIKYASGLGILSGDTATTLYNASTQFSRIKWRLDYTDSGAGVWAETDIAKWTDTATAPNGYGASYPQVTTSPANIPQLRVPSNDANTANNFVIQRTVDSLTVVSSNTALNGFDLKGRLEIWPWDYFYVRSGTNSPPVGAVGDNGLYDFDDQPSNGGGYGSFQVHDITNTKTVFAWNNHGVASPDLGIGNGPTQPDWTFCVSNNVCQNRIFTQFSVYINPPIKISLGASTISISLANQTFNKRTSNNITATSNSAGTITFYANGRQIPKCINMPITTTVTCPYKPMTHGQIYITSIFTPSDNGLSIANSSNTITSSKRVTVR